MLVSDQREVIIFKKAEERPGVCVSDKDRLLILAIKKQNNTWMCGNMEFISSADQDIKRMCKEND